LLSFANQPLPQRLGRPSLCKAIVPRNLGLQGRLVTELVARPPANYTSPCAPEPDD